MCNRIFSIFNFPSYLDVVLAFSYQFSLTLIEILLKFLLLLICDFFVAWQNLKTYNILPPIPRTIVGKRGAMF
jgi:hypothetical protein